MLLPSLLGLIWVRQMTYDVSFCYLEKVCRSATLSLKAASIIRKHSDAGGARSCGVDGISSTQ